MQAEKFKTPAEQPASERSIFSHQSLENSPILKNEPRRGGGRRPKYLDCDMCLGTFQKFVLSETKKTDWNDVTKEDILDIRFSDMMKKGAISGLCQRYVNNKSSYRRRLGCSPKAHTYYLMLADLGIAKQFGINENEVRDYRGVFGKKFAGLGVPTYANLLVRLSVFKSYLYRKTGKEWGDVTKEDILDIRCPDPIKKGAIGGLYQYYVANKSSYQNLGSEKALIYYRMLADLGIAEQFGIDEKEVRDYRGRGGRKRAMREQFGIDKREPAGHHKRVSRKPVKRDGLAESLQQPPVEIEDGWLKMRWVRRKYGIDEQMLKEWVEGGEVEMRVLQVESKSVIVYDRRQIEEAILLRREEWVKEAVSIGMGKTGEEFQKEFHEDIFPKLWKMLEDSFGLGAVRALKAVMEMKRLENNEHHFKRKNRHWRTIMEEAEECILRMKKALEREVEFELVDIRKFSQHKERPDESATLEKELNDADGQPVIVRVRGKGPWTMSLYRDGEFVLRSGLKLDSDTSLKLQKIEDYLDGQVLDPFEFEDSMKYRIGKSTGQEIDLETVAGGEAGRSRGSG